MPPRRPHILPFPPPRGSAPPGGPPPRPRPAGVVATLSIDANEVARLVARDLAHEWVSELIAEQHRRSGTPASRTPIPCGAHSLTPDGSEHGFSAAASATVAALCRHHGDALDRLVSSLPAATANAAAHATRRSRP